MPVMVALSSIGLSRPVVELLSSHEEFVGDINDAVHLPDIVSQKKLPAICMGDMI